MSGLNLRKQREDQRPTDWRFGARSQPCLATIPESKRIRYLPDGEVQKGKEDFMDCATRGPINIFETKFNFLYAKKLLKPENRKWLEDHGYVQKRKITFSDRFIAIKSRTTREGNSLVAPLQAIHQYGLIPKKMLPAKKSMTWAEYHRAADIDYGMELTAKEFKRRFKLNYDEVKRADFAKAYEMDFLDLAGYAWPTPRKGIYPDPGALPANHAFVGVKAPLHTVFDNYLDTDRDYLKRLAPDYTLYEYGYRAFVRAQAVPGDANYHLSSLEELIIQAMQLVLSLQAGFNRLRAFTSWTI